MCNTELGNFIQNNKEWEDILTREPYCLKIKRDSEFVMLSYNQITSDFNNSVVREARGIIFEEGYWDYPVCHGFDKFGNYGESYVPELDWSTAKVTEKIDGSLIKVWCDRSNTWHISTNGTINAYNAQFSDIDDDNFGKLFEESLKKYNLSIHDLFSKLATGFTYMFELVSPKTRVVIPYHDTDIYFLGYRDNSTSIEFPFFEDSKAYSFFEQEFLKNIKKPNIYSLSSLEDCIEASNKLSWDEEGYVVVDKNCNRCKIKSPNYILAHYSRMNGVITRRKLIKIILDNEVEEFLLYAEDYKDRINQLKNLMFTIEKDYTNAVTEIQEHAYDDRKEYSIDVKKYPKYIQNFLWYNYNKEVTFKEYSEFWTPDIWNNIIDCYERKSV